MESVEINVLLFFLGIIHFVCTFVIFVIEQKMVYLSAFIIFFLVQNSELGQKQPNLWEIFNYNVCKGSKKGTCTFFRLSEKGIKEPFVFSFCSKR